jgi:ribonuclease HI
MSKKRTFATSVASLVSLRYTNMNYQIAWTDGACEPNPGLGGWGVMVEQKDGNIAEYYGGEPETTNNRMEMQAVIEALRHTVGPIIIRTDSQLVLLCAVGRWKRKTNTDLWSIYDQLANNRVVLFEWWRGHVGTPGNERADELAALGRYEMLSDFKYSDSSETSHLREIMY